MIEKELQRRIGIILGESSSDWCGCYEGDIYDYFPAQKEQVTAELVDLFKEALNESGQV